MRIKSQYSIFLGSIISFQPTIKIPRLFHGCNLRDQSVSEKSKPPASQKVENAKTPLLGNY